MKKLALLISLLALGALGLGACSEGDHDEDSAASETGAALSPEQKIEQIGNEWAPLFAAGGGQRVGEYLTQPLSERITCNRLGEPMENCTPPSSEFRESFEGATVEDVAIKGRKAAARFSNGETVEFYVELNGGLIHKIGGYAGHELAADNKSCGRFGRYRFAVVEGDISCREGRGVMHGLAYNRLPGSWSCGGPDGSPACVDEAGDTIRAHARKDVLRRWRAAEAE